MMAKSSLEIFILKSLHAQNLFFGPLIYFIKGRICASNYKFRNKNDLLCAWKDFNIFFVMHKNKSNFKPQISPIFHFDSVTNFILTE